MEAGIVDYKLCDRSFDCEHCPFDEAVQSRSAKAIVALDLFADDAMSAAGRELAPNLFFHLGHSWARVEDRGCIRTGLDYFGQAILGRAYSLSFPAASLAVHQGEAFCRITHQSGVAELPAPVSGQLKQINPNVVQRPELMNRDPYGEGWLALIDPADLKRSLKQLLYGAQATDWLQTEIEKLHQLFIERSDTDPQASNITMPDGGLLTRDFMNGLSVAERRRVISSFFPQSDEEAESNQAIIWKRR